MWQAAAYGLAVLLLSPQPPEDAAKAPAPADVCLTNACGPALKPIAGPKSVREAIDAGQAFRVRDLGGSPNDAMDAILRRQVDRKAGMPRDQWPMIEELEENLRAFANISDGSALRFSDNTDFDASPGMTIVGSIERRAPDGSVQNFWLTDNGGGIWVRPGTENLPRIPIPKG